MLVAPLTYPLQMVSVPTGMLSRHKTHPSSQMPAAFVLSGVAHCDYDSRGSFGPNATGTGDPLAGGVPAKDYFDPAIKDACALVNMPKEFKELCNDLPRHRAQTIVRVKNYRGGTPRARDRHADRDTAI